MPSYSTHLGTKHHPFVTPGGFDMLYTKPDCSDCIPEEFGNSSTLRVLGPPTWPEKTAFSDGLVSDPEAFLRNNSYHDTFQRAVEPSSGDQFTTRPSPGKSLS